jgi:hypothetical protein
MNSYKGSNASESGLSSFSQFMMKEMGKSGYLTGSKNRTGNSMDPITNRQLGSFKTPAIQAAYKSIFNSKNYLGA